MVDKFRETFITVGLLFLTIAHVVAGFSYSGPALSCIAGGIGIAVILVQVKIVK